MSDYEDEVVARELRRAVTSLSDSARWSSEHSADEDDAGGSGRGGSGGGSGVLLRSVSSRSRPKRFPSDSVRSTGAAGESDDATGGYEDEEDDGRSFERFVVVGIGDNTNSASDDGRGLYDAEVVCVWPKIERTSRGVLREEGDCGAEVVTLPDFPRFAFPEQVNVWREPRGKDGGGNDASHSQKAFAAHKDEDESFLFMLRVPGTSMSLWCVCIIVRNEQLFGNSLVDELMSCGDESDDDEKETERDEEEREIDADAAELKTSRCYCIVSRRPDFAAHWRFLTQLVELMRKKRTAPRESNESFVEHLQKYRYGTGGSSERSDRSASPGDALPETPLPAPAGSDEDDCSDDFDHILANDGEHSLSMQRHESTSLHFCVQTLCRLLSLDNLLTMLAAILCEKSVIVLGGGHGDARVDVGTLTSAVLAIIPMIRPYEYQSVFMPFVPESMEDVMDAPVPFLLGVMHADVVLERIDIDPTFEVVVIDLRNDTVIQTGTEAPRLNDYDELRKKLADEHRLLRHEDTRNAGASSVGTSLSSYSLWTLFGSSKPSTTSSGSSGSGKINPRPKTKCSEDTSGRSLNPFRISNDDAKLCARFCSAISSHLTAIARRAATYTITDVRQDQRVSVLLEESFVASYAASGSSGNNSSSGFVGSTRRADDSLFVASFIDTQIWYERVTSIRQPHISAHPMRTHHGCDTHHIVPIVTTHTKQ